MPTIAERLSRSRREHFVGRVAELDLFDRALQDPDFGVCLIHINAPAGVGKTTLLREYQRRSSDQLTVWIDGKSVPPTTEDFLTAFGKSVPTPGQRLILFIDEYDSLLPLDSWFRDVFIPSLSDDAFVVLAGRQPLGDRWLSDPAWQNLARSIQLRNLNDTEQREFLELKAVPLDHRDQVIEFTRGHPLALSLVAANFAQNQELPFDPENFPDVIRSLLERFADNVPTNSHRRALEGSALLRVTTESLIGHMIEPQLAFDLFQWLRNLSFMEVRAEGVSPNDLAREAIALDLRWRNPDLNAQLHDRARGYYSDRLSRTRGEAHQQVVSDYIYLHRDNPAVKPFFDWGFGVQSYLDKYREEDRAALLTMTRTHEGEASAKILDHWLNLQPQNVVVLRGPDMEIEGFLVKLELQDLSASDLAPDPGATAAVKHLKDNAPLRKGEVAVQFRFWMDRKSHQNVSGSQSLIFVAMVQLSLSYPNLAHTFIPCSNPDFWFPVFSYSALVRLNHADFQIGEMPFGLFGHDWRILTPKKWLDLLSEREMIVSGGELAPPRISDVVLLSRETFAEAVQDALKHYNNPTKLLANPLLRSKVVTQRLGPDPKPQDRIEALRTTIKSIADSWNAGAKEAKLYDALEFGYIHPSQNQDRAAEKLDISIATFRRHLQTAVSRLTDGLWDFEIGS